MNYVNMVTLYRQSNVWVYDDEKFGRISEVLVPDISDMIDFIFTSNGINPEDHYNGFDMTFGEFLPNHSAKLERVNGDLNNETGHGNTYKLVEINTLEGYKKIENEVTGWLCSALFDYMNIAPESLYVSLEPLAIRNSL